MVSRMKRTDPSPSTALTPPVCMLRGGMTPLPQSWAPPGQQLPPALGHFQFGGAAVFRADCEAAYHSGMLPLAVTTPCELFLAADPMASSSATVAKSLLT